MSKVTFSNELNNYSSKTQIRAKIKEDFTEFSEKIFELTNDIGKLDSKIFKETTGVNYDFFNEYCSLLKNAFENMSNTSIGKRSAHKLYLTYNSKNYIMTQQGLTERAPITISSFTDSIPTKETLYDVEKICIKFRLTQ